MNKQHSPIKRLIGYLKPHKKHYILGSICSLINKIFDIAPEILIGIAVDTVVQKQHSFLAGFGFVDTGHQIIILGILTFFIWAFESLFQYLYSIQWRNLAQIVQHHLRLDTYEHMQNLDLATFEKGSTGNLVSILNDDVNQVERFLEDGVNQIIQTFSSSIIIGVIFFVIAPKVAFFAVLPIPFILFGAFYFQGKLAPRFLDVRNKAGLIASRLANNISGIFTIKAFVAENYELEKITKESENYRLANKDVIAISSMVTPVIIIAILVGFLATLIYGGFLTVNGSMAVGVFSVLVFLTQRLLWPLTNLADLTVLYERSMASVVRVLDLLDSEIQIKNEGKDLSVAKGDINFENVKFSYENNCPVIQNFNIEINSGEVIAFVGTTGSGKTTIAKLLLRFYKPDSGKILLDGEDIQSFKVKDLRKLIGVVSQDVFLFPGTVAENIAYALPNASQADIEEAAKLAEAHEFIINLTDSYQTIIGERGQKLSGGQRQRIAIARAILKNPPILILDEATSSVDNETEMAIKKSMAKIVEGRTVIMIAHRLSTIINSDKIFVIENGNITEAGSHESLLENGKIYADLWNLQTGKGNY